MQITGNLDLDRALLSAILTLITTLLLQWLQARPRIRYYVLLDSVFHVPLQNNPNFLIRTRSIRVENVGRAKAENVEIHLAFKPENFKLTPTLNFTTVTMSQNIFIIQIPTLGPREGCWIEMLSGAELPNLTNVRSDVGQARAIQIRVQPILPAWAMGVLWALLLLGMGTLFYLILMVIAYLKW